MLLASVGMRWSQKRGVRKRAAAEARRYAKYLRERERELAEAGELQRAALAAPVPGAEAAVDQVVKRRESGSAARTIATSCTCASARGRSRSTAPVELDLGMNPLAEYQKQPLHEARRLVERRATLRGEAVVVDLADVGVLAVTGDRDRSRAWARGADDPARRLARAARPAPGHRLRPRAADAWEWGKWLPHQQADPGAPASGGLLLARSAAELEAMLDLQIRPRIDQLRRIADADAAHAAHVRADRARARRDRRRLDARASGQRRRRRSAS